MTRFVYGIDGELLAEYRQNFAANAPEVEYGYCGGEQLITARPDETRWHVRDDVGTARIALDQTGSLANVRRNDYLPFGEELTNGAAGRTAARGYAPTNERNKFTGHQRDAGTGYDHTLWRKLDSVQGRWTSPDPYGGSMEIGNPQSFNRYAYVLNDPVNLMDPLGLNPFRTVCYVDGIQSDCGFALQMVDIGSAILEGNASWPVETEYEETGQRSGVRYNYVTNLNLMFRNPFPTERWVLNGLSNTLSDLIGEREIAMAAQQAGNPNESTETRLLGVAGIGFGVISNLPGGQSLKAAKRIGIVTQNGTKITGFAKHGINRAVGDGAKRAGVKPKALLDALKNPKKITSGVDSKGRPYEIFKGQDARVVVNPQTGEIVSTNPLSGSGAH